MAASARRNFLASSISLRTGKFFLMSFTGTMFFKGRNICCWAAMSKTNHPISYISIYPTHAHGASNVSKSSESGAPKLFQVSVAVRDPWNFTALHAEPWYWWNEWLWEFVVHDMFFCVFHQPTHKLFPFRPEPGTEQFHRDLCLHILHLLILLKTSVGDDEKISLNWLSGRHLQSLKFALSSEVWFQHWLTTTAAQERKRTSSWVIQGPQISCTCGVWWGKILIRG